MKKKWRGLEIEGGEGKEVDERREEEQKSWKRKRGRVCGNKKMNERKRESENTN